MEKAASSRGNNNVQTVSGEGSITLHGTENKRDLEEQPAEHMQPESRSDFNRPTRTRRPPLRYREITTDVINVRSLASEPGRRIYPRNRRKDPFMCGICNHPPMGIRDFRRHMMEMHDKRCSWSVITHTG